MTRSTSKTRAARAEINDNAGPWFLCVSKRYGVDQLESLFAKGEMPRVLVDTVGGILGSPELYRKGRYVFIQIHLALSHHAGWQLDAALDDLNIHIRHRVSRPTQDI